MNVKILKDVDLMWADFVFLGGMSIQQSSARDVVTRCKALGIKIVAGGPLFTVHQEEFDDVDYLVLNEAELTLPRFLNDLELRRPQHRYESSDWADVTTTPLPLWPLINPHDYGSMNLQYSRGCPYDCEFCDITVLYGRVPRTKTREQLLRELDSLYTFGWRGGVFFVDDNFIGNKNRLKEEILPAVIQWMEKMKYPFYFNTEASMPLARALMEAGMSQGAVLAFLITGSGTSIGAIMGALTIARWRIVALIIITLFMGAVLFGYAYNFLIVLGVL